MSSFQIKIVDDFCNLRCTYCRNRDFDQKTKRVMSIETLEKLFSVFSKSTSEYFASKKEKAAFLNPSDITCIKGECDFGKFWLFPAGKDFKKNILVGEESFERKAPPQLGSFSLHPYLPS